MFMPVLPSLKPMFDAITANSGARDERPVAEARAAMHQMISASFGALLAQRAPMPLERDYSVAVAGGAITLRIYSPARTASPLPCHLQMHGGGFWLGTLDQSDSACRALATDVGCVVASVDYRLAPEHKFPTAPEDCYAVLLWLVAHAGDLGIDVTRISVGGASAGGNLAAVVALMARDRRGPRLVAQVLEIPVTDFTDIDPLCLTDEGRAVPSGKGQYGAYYLSDVSVDARNPYASPLLAHNLAGLPPALVMCAEYDPLRKEGEAYAKRLADAGVAVEYRLWEGQFHGSQQLVALIPSEAAAYHSQIVRMLTHAFGAQ
jgi:acetyl esterase